MTRLSRRLAAVSVSASAAMSTRARQMAAEGHKVISLAQGEPDFDTPPQAIAAADAAARAGDTKYPPQDGTRALKLAVQRKFRRDNGLDYALEEIMVANGGKQVIFNALMATLDPGDEVVIPAPYWISYADITHLAGGTPVTVPCAAADGYRLRAEALQAAITPRTRWLLLNFPNNPTGAVCTREDLRAIADVLLRHPDVLVLSDDIYEHLLYDGLVFHTLAQVEPALRERVLTVNGLSKAYAMTGWRVGFCGGPRWLMRAMLAIQGHSTSGISTTAQAAAAAALDGPQDLLRERAAIYQERRDLVVAMLGQAPGLHCPKPSGAFYAYPDISGCIGRTSAGGVALNTDADFALALLEEQHVAVVQGAAYGASPAIRISFATDTESLTEACRRIQTFCAGLR